MRARPKRAGWPGAYAVATRKRKDPERLQWLEGWHPEKVDLKETARLFYQAKLFLRSHYEEEL
jgi:hypothetical protein